MARRHDEAISLDNLVHVLLRHKKKMIVWALIVMGFSLVALKVLPRKYISEAKLFVRLGRESVALDPTATTGQTLQVQETRENQINSTRDMLTSRALLESVVDAVGPEVVLTDSTDAKSAGFSLTGSVRSGISGTLRWVASMPSVSPHEAAVDKLSKAISVKIGKNSSVIDFSCESKQPELAQRLLTAFLDAYREQHRAANHTEGALTFFESQAARIKQQLDAAAEALRDAKNASQLTSLPEEQKALQDQTTRLEADSFTADAQLASTLASVESLRAATSALPSHVPTQQTAGFANVAADSMQYDNFKLRMSLRELEARLGDEHPKITALREQVRQSSTLLGATDPDRTQSTVGQNPARQALEVDLRREEAMAVALRAKAGKLKDQLAQLEVRTRELNEHEIEISMLERQVAINETSYHSYMDHLEQARIGDALDADRISNVNIVQAPTLVQTPISPKSTLILGAGLLVAVCGALGLALGSEYLEHSRKTAKGLAAIDPLALRTISSAPRHEAAVNGEETGAVPVGR